MEPGSISFNAHLFYVYEHVCCGKIALSPVYRLIIQCDAAVFIRGVMVGITYPPVFNLTLIWSHVLQKVLLSVARSFQAAVMMQQARSGKKSVGVKMRMQVISVKVAELQNRWPGCQEIQYSFTQIHSSGSALTEFAHIPFRKVGKNPKG